MIEKKTTINDVARLAGTSATTVSRVMNDVDYPVSHELRARIKDAAKKLNYSPKKQAKSMSPVSTNDIGVIIPNITNLFYPQTVIGIEDTVRNSGYNVLLFNTLRSKQRENEYLQMLYERQVKGVIISAVDNDIDNIHKYLNRGMQFVLLDQMISGAGCPSLNFDSRRGARMAVDHFVEKGHRRIAFATTPITRWTRTETFKGYKEGLLRAGIPFDEGLVLELSEELEAENANYEVDAGKMLANMYIERNTDATAILCVNDMVAFGVIRNLVSMGMRVPDDVSVIGFDDIPFASVYLPALTTVRYPAYDTGKLAGMLLLEAISNGSNKVELQMRMEPQLIERNTVKQL